MLVLSRRRGERICIGEGITVEVVDIRGDKVRLGIVAPDLVRIDRQEVRKNKDYDGEKPGADVGVPHA